MKNKKELLMNIVKIAVVIAIVVFAAVNYKTLSNLDVRSIISGADSLIAAIGIILLIYILKSVTLVIPASVIYISVGVAFDWKTAVLVNIIGIAIEVTATFFLGKFLGKDAVEKRLGGTKAWDKLINMQSKNKNLAVFLIRLIPAFPIDFASLFMGAFDFKFWSYLLFSVLGIGPRVIAFTILGDSIYEFIPMKYIVLVAIILLPIAVIAAMVKRQVSKKSHKEDAEEV